MVNFYLSFVFYMIDGFTLVLLIQLLCDLLHLDLGLDMFDVVVNALQALGVIIFDPLNTFNNLTKLSLTVKFTLLLNSLNIHLFLIL